MVGRAQGTAPTSPKVRCSEWAAVCVSTNVHKHPRVCADICVKCHVPACLEMSLPWAVVGTSGPVLPAQTRMLLLLCYMYVSVHTSVAPSLPLRAVSVSAGVSLCTHMSAHACLSLHPCVSPVKPLGLRSRSWVLGNR